MPLENKKKLIGKLKKPFRLVVVNDNSLEEKASFMLTPLNILLLFSTLFLLFFIISYLILYQSGLNRYITNGKGGGNRSELLAIRKQLEEIEHQHRIEIKRRNDIINVLQGKSSKLDTGSIVLDPEFDKPVEVVVSAKEVSGGLQSDYGFESLLFFPPLKGKISQPFNIYNHKAVDITPVISDESVKSTLDGTVVFTGWTTNFGHVIHVQHSNNLLSIYKHNSYLHKRIGDHVRAGEVIAVAGSTGELTTGVHLHFELWFNGRPLDPTKFISF